MSTLDERLSRALRTADVPADFETRLMARIHTVQSMSTSERATTARTLAQQTYDAAGRELRLWRRAALRMLTLDALGAAALVTMLAIVLPRVAPLIIALGSAAFAAAVLFSPLPRPRGRGLG
jgi:hypothetical protein